ncbi:hypothetical protein HID58_002732, partial [Brassica napus]
ILSLSSLSSRKTKEKTDLCGSGSWWRVSVHSDAGSQPLLSQPLFFSLLLSCVLHSPRFVAVSVPRVSSDSSSHAEESAFRAVQGAPLTPWRVCGARRRNGSLVVGLLSVVVSVGDGRARSASGLGRLCFSHDLKALEVRLLEGVCSSSCRCVSKLAVVLLDADHWSVSTSSLMVSLLIVVVQALSLPQAQRLTSTRFSEEATFEVLELLCFVSRAASFLGGLVGRGFTSQRHEHVVFVVVLLLFVFAGRGVFSASSSCDWLGSVLYSPPGLAIILGSSPGWLAI